MVAQLADEGQVVRHIQVRRRTTDERVGPENVTAEKARRKASIAASDHDHQIGARVPSPRQWTRSRGCLLSVSGRDLDGSISVH